MGESLACFYHCLCNCNGAVTLIKLWSPLLMLKGIKNESALSFLTMMITRPRLQVQTCDVSLQMNSSILALGQVKGCKVIRVEVYSDSWDTRSLSQICRDKPNVC